VLRALEPSELIEPAQSNPNLPLYIPFLIFILVTIQHMVVSIRLLPRSISSLGHASNCWAWI
jgi:hypothetical protein